MYAVDSLIDNNPSQPFFMIIKMLSIETRELDSGQLARVVTFDVDGEQVSRKIALDTPASKVDERILDLAEGLVTEFEQKQKNTMENLEELPETFMPGTVLFQS